MSHPLHPALVHFPVATWTLATLADGAAWLWPNVLPEQCAGVLLAAGCTFGLLAAGAGFLELLKLPAGHPAGRTANVHMSMALLTWCLYAGSLFLRVGQQQLIAPNGWALLLSGLGLLTLLATGWLGGQLVYRHGVGVAVR